MSKPKKLDLPLYELIMIAAAINENTLLNKTRSKEEKIGTDQFIRQKFNISRKDFSETIKDTEIKYNSSTFLYTVPMEDTESLKSYTKELLVKSIDTLPNKNEWHESNPSGTQVIMRKNQTSSISNTKELPKELQEFISITGEIKEMLEWFRTIKRNENIIDVPEITLDKNKLAGPIASRAFKLYETVNEEFKAYCKKNTQYKQQDLLSMALIEFMSKYK